MQANYLRELEKRYQQLASKAASALNAAHDSLESTIPSLSPKEQISLVPGDLSVQLRKFYILIVNANLYQLCTLTFFCVGIVLAFFMKYNPKFIGLTQFNL